MIAGAGGDRRGLAVGPFSASLDAETGAGTFRERSGRHPIGLYLGHLVVLLCVVTLAGR